MTELIYPRRADDIAARARMALAAYRAVPARAATCELHACLDDMWHYGYFALRNAGTATCPWPEINRHVFDAIKLFAPSATGQLGGPARAARAAADAIHRFHQATPTPTAATAPEPLYTRTEVERAADSAFDRLRQYLPLDHRHDRVFVTQAFLAFLDNPDSPYPFTSHDPDEDEDEDEDDAVGVGDGAGESGSVGESEEGVSSEGPPTAQPSKEIARPAPRRTSR
ncbi:hypothetical protein ABT160_38195 [Streptomyces sp. NPDC001941]|uniref:hypothetical protein n=1 Tax=Streptomyces sp. NPDC001941 TaxID=3154659 RepID=UPI003318839B